MKRTITIKLMALLLCVCMVFGLTACGGFTQDDIDNAVNEATAPLNSQITALEADIADKAAKITTLETEKAALTTEKTELLEDIEEIEALPPEQREELNEYAEKIVNLEKVQESYSKGAKRITDIKFRQMEALEDEVQDGYKKIREAEEYRALVRQDLQRLQGGFWLPALSVAEGDWWL